MGGRLTAASEGLGRGTTFTLRVPIGAADGADEDEAEDAAAETNAEVCDIDANWHDAAVVAPLPLRVLAADDDALCRKVLHKGLARLGASTTVVEDGAAAVAAFAAERGAFDLILLDQNMPVLTGVAATAAIRRIGEQLGLPQPPPVYLLSGDSQPEVLAAALEAGASGHLPKPVPLAAVATLLAAARRRVDAAAAREQGVAAVPPRTPPDAGDSPLRRRRCSDSAIARVSAGSATPFLRA
jgi:CheY-like chemotaxis protein